MVPIIAIFRLIMEGGINWNLRTNIFSKFEHYIMVPMAGSAVFPDMARQNALWHTVSPEASKEFLNAGVDVKTQDALVYSIIHHLAFYGGRNYYFKPDEML